MFNLLEAIAKHIEFLGFGTVADADHNGNIFYGRMPNKPDECVCVFSSDSQYGGSDDAARIQIMVRGLTVKSAYELAQSLSESLAWSDGFLSGDGAQAAFEPINMSCGLGTDEKGRELYSSNFYVRYCNF